MSEDKTTVGMGAWLTQYIEATRARYQHAAVEHERNALRLEGAAMALRELSVARDAAESDSTNTTDETSSRTAESTDIVGQQ
ncbi:hypothetical protein HN371_10515 [Candidatus Poribacteria bacterium]|nr:hypothetical protein [Candidatus Poribacteria bacterium]MBT5531430.1 hypothetical protein [Candidatus Poribacteria bacterium]MBT7101630.1 hypothetical protein [Candidatus Poribacteria bacterium]